MKKTSDEKYTICKECKYYGLSPLRMLRDRCDKCGCFMRIKTKIPGFKCPIGKW